MKFALPSPSPLQITHRTLGAIAATILMTGSAWALTPPRQQTDDIVARTQVSPLLAVELNRQSIIDTLVSSWQAQLPAGEASAANIGELRGALGKLRADQLLAASMSRTADGLKRVLAEADASDTAQSLPQALHTVQKSAGERQKAVGDPDKDLVYTPVTPCRLFDTRFGQPSALGTIGGSFLPNTRRSIVPAAKCAVPATGVKSLFVAVTTFNNTINSGGYIAMPLPSTAVTGIVDIFNVGTQWSASNTIVTTTNIAAFDVFVSQANAEVVLDVLGYFAPPTAGNGLRVLVSSESLANEPNVINGGVSNGIGNAGGSLRGVTVSGGVFNRAGTTNGDFGWYSTIGGGFGNRTGADDNTQGDFATVAGGQGNQAAGSYSTVPGGRDNSAIGYTSFAAGAFAKALHSGSFVWSDGQGTNFSSTANDQFNIRAIGGVRLNTDTTLNFEPNTNRQHINLFTSTYGSGVQANTHYFRTGVQFCWFIGGTHVAASCSPGTGGGTVMRLSSGNLDVNGTITSLSDRNAKENFGAVNAKAVLAKVIGLPLTAWNYKADEVKSRHLGPMAQDFKRAFGLGKDEKSIATTDVSGVALAAIQGLNQKLVSEGKAKDATIAAMQRELAAIKKKLGM